MKAKFNGILAFMFILTLVLSVSGPPVYALKVNSMTCIPGPLGVSTAGGGALFTVAKTTGIMTLKGLARIDNTTDVAVMELIETTIRASGAFNVTGAATLASSLGMTLTNAASASANPFDYTAILGIMNGTDDFTLFDVNLTNANHTSTGNTVRILDVAAITGDAEATETAIAIGAGWDAGLNSASPVVVGSTLDVTGNSTLASLDVGGGSGGSGATIAATGAATFDALLTANGGIVCDTNKFAVADTTGIITLGGAGTIDNNFDAAIMNLTETTVKVSGILSVTGAGAVAGTLTNMRVVNTLALDTETTMTMDTATDLSGTVYISAAAGATTVTLPAVATSAGASWEFIRSGAGNFIVTGPANTLVTNDATTAVVNATTVTYSAAGHIIGSSCKVFCDGAKWYIVNQGGTAIAAT